MTRFSSGLSEMFLEYSLPLSTECAYSICSLKKEPRCVGCCLLSLPLASSLP